MSRFLKDWCGHPRTAEVILRSYVFCYECGKETDVSPDMPQKCCRKPLKGRPVLEVVLCQNCGHSHTRLQEEPTA